MSFFEELMTTTIPEQTELRAIPQIGDALSGKITTGMYVAYLTEAYHHVKHTVPLMRLAQETFDDAHAPFRAALETYIAEEVGHEQWILDDIRNSGGDPAKAAAQEPNLATEFLVAYAYDFISRINPIGLFGMVFVLESTSMQLATNGADALAQSLKLPKESFRYLTSHGTLDHDHIAFFADLMERVDQSKDRADIVHMAKRSFRLYGDVFRSISYDGAVPA